MNDTKIPTLINVSESKNLNEIEQNDLKFIWQWDDGCIPD